MCTVQGGAVTALLPRAPGSTVFGPPDWPPELAELIISRHGGTMSLVTLLFLGRISWLGGLVFWLAGEPVPPGLSRTVLALRALFAPCMHGCMATVWSSALLGTTTWFDPGGVRVVSCLVFAEPHGGTTSVIEALCLGMTTVRTPGA